MLGVVRQRPCNKLRNAVARPAGRLGSDDTGHRSTNTLCNHASKKRRLLSKVAWTSSGRASRSAPENGEQATAVILRQCSKQGRKAQQPRLRMLEKLIGRFELARPAPSLLFEQPCGERTLALKIVPDTRRLKSSALRHVAETGTGVPLTRHDRQGGGNDSSLGRFAHLSASQLATPQVTAPTTLTDRGARTCDHICLVG